jgi:hypothetical protein
MSNHESEPQSVIRPNMNAEALPLPASQLGSVRRLVDFFAAAGIVVRIDVGWHLFVRGRQVEDIPHLPDAAGPGSPVWRHVVDEIAWKHARSEAAGALKNHLLHGADLRVVPLPREKGFAINRHREQLAVIRATDVEIPGHALIYGNFLTGGSQWEQVARVLRELNVNVSSDTASKPESLRRIDQLPAHLGQDFIEACLRASYQIRTDRQQAYDRPVILESTAGELTFYPIAGVPPELHVPFAFLAGNRAGNSPVRGRLLLGKDDPIPAMIESGASDEVAVRTWVTALLGFADATCFKREGTSHGTSRTAHSHQPYPGHRKQGSSGTVTDSRSWPHHLQPTGGWTRYAGSYVAAHRRSLSNDQDHSDEARDRAWQVGIALKPHETWVQAHVRGIPHGTEMRFHWRPPKQLGRV